MYTFKKILIIQTAFIGDVILATALIEKLNAHFPGSKIDFLLRKGNEGLLKGHPIVRKVIIWDKRQHKRRNLWKVVQQVRANGYDLVINLQRFTSSGLITAFSKAKMTLGFKKNPFSPFFTQSFDHLIGDGTHEVSRNLKLVEEITDQEFVLPKLYIDQQSNEKIRKFKSKPYLTIAPTSVWFTKQFPAEKWVEFIKNTGFEGVIYLLGGSSDYEACEFIRENSKRDQVINLCGQLTLLESAALMQEAKMNYVNDSAPQHLASALNAPVCTIFCSTVPAFGFGPLSDEQHVVEVKEKLDCRPCGLHGYKSCPEGHFKCAKQIETSFLETVL